MVNYTSHLTGSSVSLSCKSKQRYSNVGWNVYGLRDSAGFLREFRFPPEFQGALLSRLSPRIKHYINAVIRLDKLDFPVQCLQFACPVLSTCMISKEFDATLLMTWPLCQ